jgi:glycosyltransferase involved in cell wall biosynthesis
MAEKKLPGLLFIVQLPPPLHGASIMNSHIVKSKIIAAGFRTEIVNLHFAENVSELGKFSFSKVYLTFVYAIEIVRKVIILRPSLVYFNLTPKGFAFYRDAFYVFLLKMFRRRIVLHLQSKGIRESTDRNPSLKLLYRMVLRNTFIICLSPRLTDDFDHVYGSEPYFVPNGLENQSSLFKGGHKPKEKVPAILYLSHYLRSKGVLVLIEALGILKRSGFLFTARIAGPPADLTIEDLEKAVAEENLQDMVAVTGPKYGEEKISEFRNADIFVFPTYNEVFGLVLLEAMQSGLPVVTTFEGAIPDIVSDNITGYLVEAREPDLLAEKLALLVGDPDLRHKMGHAGLERFLEKYTLDKFEENIRATITTILKTNV